MNKPAQNLPSPQLGFHSGPDWGGDGGDGAYPQLGGQEEVRTIHGEGQASQS